MVKMCSSTPTVICILLKMKTFCCYVTYYWSNQSPSNTLNCYLLNVWFCSCKPKYQRMLMLSVSIQTLIMISSRSLLLLCSSIQFQCCDSLWAQWSSEKILSSFKAAGIPISPELSREDLFLLAQNTLVRPPVTADATTITSAQTKEAGKKT